MLRPLVRRFYKGLKLFNWYNVIVSEIFPKYVLPNSENDKICTKSKTQIQKSKSKKNSKL